MGGRSVRPLGFPRPRAASRDGALTLSTRLLAGACVLLAGLAVTMGVVSWHAQYAFVLAAKHERAASALEALGVDAGAVIFSSTTLYAGFTTVIRRARINSTQPSDRPPAPD
ncbi:MAG: hypothetical protein ACLPUO_00865 [Streptosporangiaceae bacterium]